MKYKAKFTAPASIKEETFASFAAKSSLADMSGLNSLLPSREEMSKNPDLLHITCPIATVNVINYNGHGILTETALSLNDRWKFKFIDSEHDRQTIIGFITNAGFSTFSDHKILSAQDIEGKSDMFNICASGIIWKAASPWVAEWIKECGDPKSEYHGQLSASWELAFDSFWIALGSKVLSRAEIIKEESQVKELSQYLSQFGGSGFTPDNKECYMIITGKVTPLAFGLVRSPAAPIQGILCSDPLDIPDEEDDSKAEIIEKASITVVTEQENDKNIKNNFTPVVKRVLRSDMKFTDLDNFVDKYSEAIAKNEVIATSDVRDFVKESLLKSAEGWKSELEKQEEKAALAAKKADEMQAALDVAKEDAKTNATALEALRAELAEVKAKAEEATNRQIFDARMNELEEKYDLSDKVRSVIAKSILNKDEDQYNEWLANEGEVILAGKEKKAVTVEDSLKTATASADHVPNADATEEVKVAKALKPTAKREGRDFVISLN